MASVDATRHGPKLRARKDGAAIALDELDKRLLNLMQGQFPIAPRPYQHVASKAEVTEDEVLELEREAFVSLCGEPKSQERMQYMLMNNKPLRN